MKIKFEMNVTREEHAILVTNMKQLMSTLHFHLTFVPTEQKEKAMSNMLRDLNRIPGITVKSKNVFGSLLYTTGIKDNIDIVVEIDTNTEAIEAVFDIAKIGIDIVGPFINAGIMVSKGRALEELKTVLMVHQRRAKPDEFSIERQTVLVNEEK